MEKFQFNHLMIETNGMVKRKGLQKPIAYNIRRRLVFNCREMLLSDAPDARDVFFRAHTDVILHYGDIFKPNLKPWCGLVLRNLALGNATQIVVNAINSKGIHYKLYFCETTNAPLSIDIE